MLHSYTSQNEVPLPIHPSCRVQVQGGHCQDHFSTPNPKSAVFTFGTWFRKKSPYQGNLVSLTKGVKVLEIAVGAVFASTRFFLVRISIRDLVADGKSLVRNSGVGGGGQNLILTLGRRGVALGACLTIVPCSSTHKGQSGSSLLCRHYGILLVMLQFNKLVQHRRQVTLQLVNVLRAPRLRT